jgi:hypothetical protein
MTVCLSVRPSSEQDENDIIQLVASGIQRQLDSKNNSKLLTDVRAMLTHMSSLFC